MSDTENMDSLETFYSVPRRGLEPPWIAPLAPKASASTNFATSAVTHIVTKKDTVF